MATIIRNSGGGGKIAYELAINIPTGVSEVTLERTASGLGEAELIGGITASDPIYKGDVLVTSGVAQTGYNDPTGITYEVTGNLIATVTVSPIEYGLTIAIPTGVDSMTVNRTASPIGGSIGEITEDDVIYYGDILVTSGVVSEGYYDPSGLTYTVSGDTTVSVTRGLRQALNVSFVDASWDEVAEVAAAIRDGILTVQTASSGYKYVSLQSYTWTVGDTKTLTISSTSYTIRILDFQHWTNENNVGTVYADYGNTDAINMGMVEIYNTYTHGITAWTGNWSGSLVYNYIKGTFFNLLPTEFSEHLLNVTVRSSQGRAASTSTVDTDGKCNLPTMQEVGLGSYTYCSSYSGYEKGYELNYYSVNNNNSSRIKYYSGSTSIWWTRTPASYVNIVSEARYWCGVSKAGAGYYDPVSDGYGVSPLFSY